ncbi:hypothetical protein JTB14_015037 [Gonioctena quinquepunctata]|nr:hypothetical protein JTB14_015037 [Gonioctena quinquepunctata]
MSCSGNKIRVPNFTNAERIHLVQLIARKYAVILEDKKTDRTSTLQKDEAWQAIEQDFNSSSGSDTFRKAACLKKCYENRKKKLRKMLAEERRETMLTGGGPPPKLKKNEDEDMLLSFVNKKTLVGLENRFDDDAEESLIQVQDEQDEILEYVEDRSDEEPIPSTSTLDATASQKKHVTEIRGGENNSTPDDFSTNNWQKYTPKQLQMPINSVLTVTEKKSCEDNKTTRKSVSRRRPATVVKTLTSSDIAKKYNLLLDKRLQLLDAQHAHMEEENALIIKKRKLEVDLLEMEILSKNNK